MIASVFLGLLFAAQAEVTDPELLNVVATKVRLHGYTCDVPDAMVRERKTEEQGERIWVITCDDGERHYRVRLYSNNKSKVRELEHTKEVSS
jgi:hypothetical protein